MYLEGKLAAVVVHPTGIHQAEDISNIRGVENLGSGLDMDTRDTRNK